MTRAFCERLKELIWKASSSLSDGDALDAIILFKLWKSNTWYDLGERIRLDDTLYRVEQGHTSSALYPPGAVGSEALYAEVEKPGQGDSPENPIQYNNNMELIEGKYYEQFGIVYICTRSTINPVYNNLADLVGQFVAIYE